MSNEESKMMIVKNHYSHAWTIAELCLGIYDDVTENEFFSIPETLGTIVFGPVAGAQVAESISPLLNNGNLWELKRLWIDDRLGKNTESWSIAASIKYIKQHHPNILCLVSYADPDAGHNGGIYQATNWLFQDIERPKGTSGYVVSFDDGKTWIHSRTLFNQYGTFNRDKLIKQLPRPFLVKELSVKYRYIYPLGDKRWKKKLLSELNHPIKNYPKQHQKEEITKYD